MRVYVKVAGWEPTVEIEVDPEAPPEIRFETIDAALAAARVPVFTILALVPLVARAVGYLAVDPFLSTVTYAAVPHTGAFRVSRVGVEG